MTAPSLAASTLSVNSYKRNNRTVAEFYDAGACTYGYRVDLGAVREFKMRRQMEAALDAEFTPIVRVPDLPQLPANIPARQTKRQALAQLRSRGNVIPTRGIIPLTAPKPPQTTQPTPAQKKALSDFLGAVERYFQTFNESVNGNSREFALNRGYWKLRNAELAAGQAAMQYAQYCQMGI